MNIQYHYKKAAVLLKRGQPSGVNRLFFVHDGTGRIEGYFKVAELVERSFAVYGITLDGRVGYAPQTISIEELAISYIEQMKHVQPEGPYCIAGWSIGGTIAAEMARILEADGEEVGCCVLVDAPPPGYYPPQDAQPFSAASETDYIRPFLCNEEPLKRWSRSRSAQAFWNAIADTLQPSDFDRPSFLRYVREEWADIFPDGSGLSLHQLFCAVNIVRTLHRARAAYVPRGSIDSPVHVFQATESPLEGMDRWGRYCAHPVYIPAEGSHYSLFDAEHAPAFARHFNRILEGAAAQKKSG